MTWDLDATRFIDTIRDLENVDAAERRRILTRVGAYLRDETRNRATAVTGDVKLGNSFRFVAGANKVTVGSRKIYAGIRHYGGAIRPSGDPRYEDPRWPLPSRRGTVSRVTGKPIKYLTIPIDARKNTTAADYQDSFVFKSKKGTLFIAQRARSDPARGGRTAFRYTGGRKSKLSKKSQRMRLLFVLVKKAVIRAQPYADPTPKNLAEVARLVRDGVAQSTKNLH